MTIVDIIRRDAIDALGLRKRTLTGKGHSSVLLRRTMCLVLRKRGWSLMKIAAALEYKDHTSVMHAIRRMAARYDTDAAYAAKVDALAAYRLPPVKLAA